MLDKDQFHELLLQSLEHERGGITVYETALTCAIRGDLKKEWTLYLDQTRQHVATLEQVFEALEIDTDRHSVGRDVVRSLGASLVEAMETAKISASPLAAQLVACECVVIAETKDHADWELLNACVAALRGAHKQALKEACENVEDQEDEHLYHTKGYCRELWLEALGLPAVLPPPEEQKHVKTAIGAARAQQESEHKR